MTKKNFIALADVIKRHTLDIAKAPLFKRLLDFIRVVFLSAYAVVVIKS